MFADVVESLDQIRFDADAHVFGALDHQRLVDQTAQEIFLPVFIFGGEFVRRTILAVVGNFVFQLHVGVLVVRLGNNVVIHASDNFLDHGGFGLGAGGGRGKHSQGESQRGSAGGDAGKSNGIVQSVFIHGVLSLQILSLRL